MTKKLSFFLLFTLFSCFSIAAVRAADLSGTVRDAETAEAVIGAIVAVQPGGKGAMTDVEGRWSIGGIPPGIDTLMISFTGYRTQRIALDGGSDQTLDILLEEEARELDQVVASGRRVSNNENAMVATVQAAPQVTSGVSAAQIAKSPDRTASEVVRRVPGITILDERFIIVRGLSQRYNNAWLNGLSVPSTETDSRAFSFDVVPGSLIDNLLVYKSPSPEIPGDFSGGFVKITTKGVPDRNTTEFGVQTGFNVLTQFTDFRKNPGSATDFLGFDASKRPLGKDFPSHLSTVTDPAEITRITKTDFNDDWSIRSVTPLPDIRLSYSMARRMETRRGKTVGNITAINYSNTNKTTEGIKNARYGIYSAAADRPIYINDYSDDQYTNDVRIGAMHNWSFLLNSNNRIEFKNLFNLLGHNRLTERSGTYEGSGGLLFQRQTEMLYSSRLTYTGQLSGNHDFSNRGTLAWDAGYSYANRHEPDRRIASYETGVGSVDDIPSAVLRNSNIKRYFETLDDNSFAVSANYKQPFRLGGIEPILRTGVFGEFRDRDYRPREFIYLYDRMSYDERRAYLLLPFEEMVSDRYMDAENKAYIAEATDKRYSYAAEVLSGAFYGVLEIPLGRLQIYAGARLESYNAKLTYDRAMAVDDSRIYTLKREESTLLPSVNVTYKFNDKHQLRAAYGRSLNRPELRELSPSVYYDFDLFSFVMGNPDLKTALIDNLDLRYEFYPALGETVSIGAFYKHFRNPIEWTYRDNGSINLQYLYENAKEAVNWGFEADVRKNLAFLRMPDLSLVLNASWIESNVSFPTGEVFTEHDRPMQGQSPYIVNAGLYYQSEKAGLDLTLLYNRIGRRIVGLGKATGSDPDPNTIIPDSYEMPRNSLDFNVSKRLGERIVLRASVKDMLSEEVVYKQFPRFVAEGIEQEREQVTRRYNPGQSVTVGVSIKW